LLSASFYVFEVGGIVLEDIGFGGMRNNIWRRVFGYGFVFAGQLESLASIFSMTRRTHTRLFAARLAIVEADACAGDVAWSDEGRFRIRRLSAEVMYATKNVMEGNGVVVVEDEEEVVVCFVEKVMLVIASISIWIYYIEAETAYIITIHGQIRDQASKNIHASELRSKLQWIPLVLPRRM
jgi:hypothetical protein